MSHTMVLALIMFVPLITWAGVFAYLLRIDRALKRLENSAQQKDQDDL